VKRTMGRRRSSLARATFVTGYEVDVEAVAMAMLRDVPTRRIIVGRGGDVRSPEGERGFRRA
jgi:hypothetical protein